MSTKPFRNSKGVDKPFRSPFSTPKIKNNENITNTPESNRSQTLLNRSSMSKKSLFQTPPTKKLRLSDEHTHSGTIQNTKLCRNDLELLKSRIQEKQVTINNLKTTLLYKKKNNPEDLRNIIKKWTKVCQIVLRDYQNYLAKRNGQPVSIIDILSSFGVDHKLVNYSPDNDTFDEEPSLNM
ncbi:swi5-dependent recombination DNA repair protein 1 homolog isoform X2 [Augochlora pura]